MARLAVDAAPAVVPVVAIIAFGWARRWTADDGFINLRVVEQILAGNGPVFNAGERVEIATSPAWVAVLGGPLHRRRRRDRRPGLRGPRRSRTGCAALRPRDRILRATNEPMSPKRFVANMKVALTTYGARISGDPARDAKDFCGR